MSNDPLSLRREGTTRRVHLSANQRFRIIPDPREGFEGEFKSQTLAYIYSIQAPNVGADADPEIVAWHWHPLTTPERPGPHVHVRVDHPGLDVAVSDLHIPSGRVSFEDVVSFLMSDLDVEAARDDWREVLAESQERFRTFRSWA